MIIINIQQFAEYQKDYRADIKYTFKNTILFLLYGYETFEKLDNFWFAIALPLILGYYSEILLNDGLLSHDKFWQNRGTAKVYATLIYLVG